MTDITELAQSLKAAAENAGIEQWVSNHGEVNAADYEIEGGTYIDHVCNCEIVGTESPRGDFIALANPANVLALVEALEKAQEDGNEYAASERAVVVNNVALQDEIYGLKARIAELESSVIAPGIMRCAKCSFVLTKNSINMSAGTITAGDSKSEPCPNGCGPLWPVTWREKALQARDDSEQWFEDFQTAKKRIAELERFRTAYMEWSDKTDWVQTDKRFEALKPWGKHRADVLKAYIEHLEPRTVTVDADVSDRNQPGMVVAVHIDAGDFVKFRGQVYEVKETDFDDHDVTLWFVCGEVLKCAAGCQIEVVSAPEEAE